MLSRVRDKPVVRIKIMIEETTGLMNQSFRTFHPMFSKNVHNLVCPVVFPPHGPENTERWVLIAFTQDFRTFLCINLIEMMLDFIGSTCEDRYSNSNLISLPRVNWTSWETCNFLPMWLLKWRGKIAWMRKQSQMTQ